MQHLYLTSSFHGRGIADMIMNSIEKLLNKPVDEIKVAYITTAGNLHPTNERGWIDEGRNILKERGWQVFDYDIADKTESEVENEIADKDVIFIQGGQCIYMLEQVQKCNFDQIVKRAVARGVLYIGESTGSIITGRDISAYRYWAKDRREDPPKLTSYQGIGLVNFLIRPHWHHPEKRQKYLQMTRDFLEKIYDIPEPIIMINDDQLIYVEGDKFQIWEEHKK